MLTAFIRHLRGKAIATVLDVRGDAEDIHVDRVTCAKLVGIARCTQ